jgi:hypothetical protein
LTSCLRKLVPVDWLLINIFVQKLVQISQKAYDINYEKYKHVLEYLGNQVDKAKTDKDKNNAERK